jgi:hypothetical protein
VVGHTLLQGHTAAFFAPSVVADEIAAGSLVPLQVTDLPAILCDSALVVHDTADNLPRQPERSSTGCERSRRPVRAGLIHPVA